MLKKKHGESLKNFQGNAIRLSVQKNLISELSENRSDSYVDILHTSATIIYSVINQRPILIERYE